MGKSLPYNKNIHKYKVESGVCWHNFCRLIKNWFNWQKFLITTTSMSEFNCFHYKLNLPSDQYQFTSIIDIVLILKFH